MCGFDIHCLDTFLKNISSVQISAFSCRQQCLISRYLAAKATRSQPHHTDHQEEPEARTFYAFQSFNKQQSHTLWQNRRSVVQDSQLNLFQKPEDKSRHFRTKLFFSYS